MYLSGKKIKTISLNAEWEEIPDRALGQMETDLRGDWMKGNTVKRRVVCYLFKKIIWLPN